ncbi:MAG: 16S rRNA processing protein RimM [Deltaproteobacteria bacterium]|nr:16S rRNA processing protein RimM [Deltaproteobacteria bacterium]
MHNDSDWVRLATIGRPHGVRGEVRVWLDNPDSELLWQDVPMRLERDGKPPQTVVIDQLRPGGDSIIAKIAGVESREDAAKLTHAAIAVPRSALPALEDGEFYHVDVIGAAVYDAESGAELGRVKAITHTSIDVLVVQTHDGAEVLLPINADYVPSIGETPGRVEVRNLDHWR